MEQFNPAGNTNEQTANTKGTNRRKSMDIRAFLSGGNSSRSASPAFVMPAPAPPTCPPSPPSDLGMAPPCGDGGDMMGVVGPIPPPAMPPPPPPAQMESHAPGGVGMGPACPPSPLAEGGPTGGGPSMADLPPVQPPPPPPQCGVDGTDGEPAAPPVPDLAISLPALIVSDQREGESQGKWNDEASAATLNERHGLPSNLSREIREMLLSGGPTPHMVTVGPTGKDEIVLGGTDRRTQTKKRIERLDTLSRVPRSDLNAHEKEAKLRLLKLESNRRAAQVSRQKKKRYIANLEERAAMMAKHLAALEIENGQLRALLAEVAGKAMPGGIGGGIALPGGGVLEFPMPAPQLPLPLMKPFSPKSEPATPLGSKPGSAASSLRNSQKRTLNDMFASDRA